jgi:hypothetical protein
VLAVVYFGAVIGYTQNYESLSSIEKILLITGLFGFIVFWSGMLSHFFLNVTLKHKVVWGFSLLFLSWLSALIYFFMYFINELRESKNERVNGVTH